MEDAVTPATSCADKGRWNSTWMLDVLMAIAIGVVTANPTGAPITVKSVARAAWTSKLIHGALTATLTVNVKM